MSVMIAIKFPVSADVMEKVVNDHRETMMSIIEDGKSYGAIHHQFAADPDGAAMVVDEWPDEESFRSFFEEASPDIMEMMDRAGVTTRPEPEFWRHLDVKDDIG
jgi:hypothetical protein